MTKTWGAFLVAFMVFWTPGVTMELRLSVQPSEIIFSEYRRFTTELVNDTGRDVAVARGLMRVDILLWSDGEWKENQYGVPADPGAVTKNDWITLRPGERITWTGPGGTYFCRSPVECEDWDWREGTYRFKATLSHRANPLAGQGPADGTKTFEGKLESNTVEIRVVRPVGVDAEVLGWARTTGLSPTGDEVLALFPSSRYAAYRVRAMMRQFPEREPLQVVTGILSKDFLRLEQEALVLTADSTIKYQTRKDGLQELDAVEWRAKWIETALTHHPDIWFADELRLRLAIDQLAIGNTRSAAEQLRELARKEDCPMRERARGYLELMREKGMIEATGVEASNLRGTESPVAGP